MDLDSICGGTPATKGWFAPVCGDIHAHDLFADHLYLTDGGSGIPGPPGPPGEQGPQGPPGQSASISVESVTTGAPGSAVIFQNIGAGPSAAFVVSIPRGDPGVGEQGPPGNIGAQGPAGTLLINSVATGIPGSAASVINVGTVENASLNITIPRGDRGLQGIQGEIGPAGAQGTAGILSVGTVTTGEPGTAVSFVNVGTSENATFDISIPRGDVGAQGPQGDTGPAGAQGPAGILSVGTVTTGDPGSAVSFVNVGTPENATFNISIPRGDTGITGDTGVAGPAGAQGPAGILSVGTVTTGDPGSAVSFVNIGTPENATFDISIPRGDIGPQGPQGDTGPAGEPGGSASILSYHANTTTHLPASTIGDLVWNTTEQITATIIYLSHRQVGGQDVERILELATVSSTILIQAQTNSAQYIDYTLLEPPVVTANEYVAFHVVASSFGGSSFANNNNLLVSIITAGAPGPAGPPGEAGPTGATGAQGDPGPAGSSATITVGTTTTTAAGTNASVTAVGTTLAQIFNFSIPRGDTGAAGGTGAQGTPGPAGTAATLTVGTTTTTAAGTNASVTAVGTTSAQIFNFDIPRGNTGVAGPTGAQGNPGPAGSSATLAVGTTTTTAAGTNASVTAVGTTSAQIFNFDIPRGNTGAAGPTGAQGDPGPAGASATITVGSTTTTAAGTSASVTSSGPSSARILDFSIPRGDTGAAGAPGDQGNPGAPGAAATLDVGITATLPSGSSATVTQSGTSSARIFSFGIPTGPQGIQGIQGIQGTAGNTGATPVIAIGSVTAADYPTCSATMDVTNPAAPVLSLVVPRGPAGVGGVTVNNTATSLTQRLLFTNTVTGGTATALNTHASSLSYVPSTNILTSTGNITAASFTGPLTGNASTATQITSTTSSSTNAHYVTFSDVNGGSTNLRTATLLTYTPGETGGATLRVPKILATGDITAPTFTGLASDASQVVTVNTSASTIRYLCLTPTNNTAGGNPADIQTATALSYVPSTDVLSVGTVTATTLNGSLTGNAATATKVTSTNSSTSTAQYVTFVPINGAAAATDIRTGTPLTYTPSTGMLTATGVTATTLAGALSGNASSATQVSTIRNVTNLNRYIIFSPNDNAAATAADLMTATLLTYNPSAQTLTVPNLTVSGTLSATVASANNLSGTSAGSIPYQSASGTTSYVANGTSGYILKANGGTLAPTWSAPSAIIRGYTVPFSSGGTVAGYQYANVGAAGRTDVAASGVLTKFIVPIAGTIEAATVVWSTAAAASTFSIMKGAASAYTSGIIFTAAGGTATITSGLLVNVVVGDVIEVRTNTLNFGPMTVVLYMT